MFYRALHCVKSVCIRSSISPYSVQILENTDQKNSEYWHFLCSDTCASDSFETWSGEVIEGRELCLGFLLSQDRHLILSFNTLIEQVWLCNAQGFYSG